MLQDYQNYCLLLIREMDAYNFGGVPNYGTTFNNALLTSTINDSIDETLMLTNFSPKLTDKIFATATTTVTDYPVPSDLVSLQRLEYQQAPVIQTSVTSAGFGPGIATVTYVPFTNPVAALNVGTSLVIDTLLSGKQETVQVTALGGTPSAPTFTAPFSFSHSTGCIVQSGPLTPYRLGRLAPDEFDSVAGTGMAPVTVITIGLPYWYREITANAVRFYPAIGSIQVINGDSVVWTYSSLGTTLVNPTDVANIPIPFQRGVCYRAASDLWKVKADDDQADYYDKKWQLWCSKAKGFRWDQDQSGVYGFIDEAIPGSLQGGDWSGDW